MVQQKRLTAAYKLLSKEKSKDRILHKAKNYKKVTAQYFIEGHWHTYIKIAEYLQYLSKDIKLKRITQFIRERKQKIYQKYCKIIGMWYDARVKGRVEILKR